VKGEKLDTVIGGSIGRLVEDRKLGRDREGEDHSGFSRW